MVRRGGGCSRVATYPRLPGLISRFAAQRLWVRYEPCWEHGLTSVPPDPICKCPKSWAIGQGPSPRPHGKYYRCAAKPTGGREGAPAPRPEHRTGLEAPQPGMGTGGPPAWGMPRHPAVHPWEERMQGAVHARWGLSLPAARSQAGSAAGGEQVQLPQHFLSLAQHPGWRRGGFLLSPPWFWVPSDSSRSPRHPPQLREGAWAPGPLLRGPGIS